MKYWFWFVLLIWLIVIIRKNQGRQTGGALRNSKLLWVLLAIALLTIFVPVFTFAYIMNF